MVVVVDGAEVVVVVLGESRGVQGRQVGRQVGRWNIDRWVLIGSTTASGSLRIKG